MSEIVLQATLPLPRWRNPITASDAFLVSILAVTLTMAISAGEGRISISVIALLGLVTLAALVVGRATLEIVFQGRSLPTECGFRALAEPLLGTCLMSLVGCALSILLNISAGTALVISIGSAVVAGVWLARQPSTSDSCQPTDLVVLTGICGGAVVWSLVAIGAVSHMNSLGVFPAWSDFFIHAGEIAQLAAYADLHAESIFASGAALPPYHYASYLLPAAICNLTGVQALAAATALWTPLGFILLGQGAYALGCLLGGRGCGALSVASVLALPDASHYGFRNPFFSFHWLLQISPTGSYAVGLAMLSLGLAVLALRDRSSRAGVASLALMLSIFVFRVQICVPLVVTGLALVVFFWRPQPRWLYPAALMTTIVALIVAIVATTLIPRSPDLLGGKSHVVEFMRMALAQQNSAHPGLFNDILGGPVEAASEPVAFAVGAALLMLSEFGLLLPGALSGMVWFWGRGSGRPETIIPAIAIASYLLMLLTFSNTDQEPSEFFHRPFVFVYAVLAVWCAYFVRLSVPSWLYEPSRLPAFVGIGIVTVCAPFLFFAKAQTSNLAWAASYTATIVPEGLRKAASFVRSHAGPSDVVASAGGAFCSPLIALSERQAFFPGEAFLIIQSGISPESLAAKAGVVADLAAAPNWTAFTLTAQQHGISWYVAYPGTQLAPSIIAQAQTSDGGFMVLDTRQRALTAHHRMVFGTTPL